MKYIDAEKLKVLIQQLIGECIRNNWSTTEYCLRKILSAIDSLQQEQTEVDLEKEVANWWNEHYADIKKGYTFEGYNGHYMENSTVISLAKHFYELGLRAGK